MSLMEDDDLDFLEGGSDDGSGFDASALLADPILDDDDSGEFGLSNAAGSSGGIEGGRPLSMPNNPTMPNSSNLSSFDNNNSSNMGSQIKMQGTMQQQQNLFQKQPQQHQQNSFSGFNQDNNMNNSMNNSMNTSMNSTNNNMNNMNNSMNNMNSSMSSMNSNMQMPQHQLMHNRHNGGADSFMPLNDTNGMQVQESQEVVTMKMQKLQQQIQQVQSQIQHVQFQSNRLEMQSSHVDAQNSAPQNGMSAMNMPQNHLNNMGNMSAMNNMSNMNNMNAMNNMNNMNQSQNQQSPFGLQGMMNPSSGMNRRAPDRSFSAPVVPRSVGFRGNFMEPQQERRHEKQPQAGTSLAAMAASLQGGGQASSGQGSTGGEPPGNVNEAMEKLCESMRRSAMSRSMVRQLSGRSAPNSRGMSRSKSGGLPRGTLGRNASGRSIQRAHSGTDSLRGAPIRRPTQDTKYRIQRDALSNSGGPPGRGVFRHKSSQGALGGTTRLQIDDSTVGMF
ncbi:unnamed protein product [Cylindrotheca closterium]|uniref:Uncharacterized protein n=1 Tax=Cylindrotheca closterium TaxID=2856 RepID=A0AAD2CIP8_9STRA|nr:unnamed protein product [Cylindrotheca closterium]